MPSVLGGAPRVRQRGVSVRPLCCGGDGPGASWYRAGVPTPAGGAARSHRLEVPAKRSVRGGAHGAA